MKIINFAAKADVSDILSSVSERCYKQKLTRQNCCKIDEKQMKQELKRRSTLEKKNWSDRSTPTTPLDTQLGPLGRFGVSSNSKQNTNQQQIAILNCQFQEKHCEFVTIAEFQ